MAITAMLSAILLWAADGGPGQGAGNGGPGQASWCSPPRPTPGVSVAPSRDDVEFTFVSRDRLAEALHRLSRRPIIALNGRDFRRFARNGALPTPGKHLYLARAGVMAPIDLPEQETAEYAEGASYYASVSTSRSVLNIASLMTSSSQQAPRNYAILVSSSTPVTDVVVGCIGGR